MLCIRDPQYVGHDQEIRSFDPPLLQTDQFKHFANTSSFMECILSMLLKKSTRS
jgi:hypothetical protein